MVAQAPATSPRCEAYRRAFDRAKAEKLVAFPNGDGTRACKAYTVTVTGPHPLDLACTCPGGAHVACKHRACVGFCRKHRVRPIRPAAPMAEHPMAHWL